MSATDTSKVVADALETFLQQRFRVDPKDPDFDRDTHLWQSGILDSIALAEILSFLDAKFTVKVPDYLLVDERLGSVNGMATAVAKLIDKKAK